MFQPPLHHRVSGGRAREMRFLTFSGLDCLSGLNFAGIIPPRYVHTLQHWAAFAPHEAGSIGEQCGAEFIPKRQRTMWRAIHPKAGSRLSESRCRKEPRQEGRAPGDRAGSPLATTGARWRDRSARQAPAAGVRERARVCAVQRPSHAVALASALRRQPSGKCPWAVELWHPRCRWSSSSSTKTARARSGERGAFR